MNKARQRPASGAQHPPAVTSEQRHEMISIAAYYRAERRGFAPGREVDDWCVAAATIDRLLEGGTDGVTLPTTSGRIGLRNALRLLID